MRAALTLLAIILAGQTRNYSSSDIAQNVKNIGAVTTLTFSQMVALTVSAGFIILIVGYYASPQVQYIIDLATGRRRPP